MTLVRTVTFVVVAGVLALAVTRARDPHRTWLPIGTTDLSTVRAELERLPVAERALVLGYVVRSGGDVLPPKFADPDDPLTARTFGEAIALQRRFLAQQATAAAEAERRSAARAVDRAPLLAALEVELVSRAIVPKDSLYVHIGPDFGQALPRELGEPVLLTTYRLRNASSRAVDELHGSVVVRAATPTDSEQLDGCFLSHDKRLEPNETVDLRCGDPTQHATARDSVFVNLSRRDFVLEWRPTSIRFSDGTTLEHRGD